MLKIINFVCCLIVVIVFIFGITTHRFMEFYPYINLLLGLSFLAFGLQEKGKPNAKTFYFISGVLIFIAITSFLLN